MNLEELIDQLLNMQDRYGPYCRTNVICMDTHGCESATWSEVQLQIDPDVRDQN